MYEKFKEKIRTWWTDIQNKRGLNTNYERKGALTFLSRESGLEKKGFITIIEREWEKRAIQNWKMNIVCIEKNGTAL